jgi:putative phosphoribosyl transferase
MYFHDRAHAGRLLAGALLAYREAPQTLILALPRGGVPVAREIATSLRLPWDVLIVRKLGAPAQPELAMGAIASGGVRVLNQDVISGLGIYAAELEAAIAREEQEVQRRERLYRQGRPPLEWVGKQIILVDDGVATGATLRAAIALLRQTGAGRILVAVPVAPPQAVDALRREADELVCLFSPHAFSAIGQWYDDFSQLTDAEVQQALAGTASVS